MKRCAAFSNRAVSNPGRLFQTLLLVLVAIHSAQACKYSVRDLAFVNVHGAPWKLIAVPPAVSQPDQVSRWRAIMSRVLADSNVDYQWSSDPDIIAKFAAPVFPDGAIDSLPRIVLVGSDDQVTRVWPQRDAGDEDFEDALQSLVHSPLRDRILDELARSLCVFVLFEGNDGSTELQKILRSAAERTTKQMWMLDKAPQAGPQVVIVPADDRRREHWMVRSLGIDPTSHETSVAVLFGQGRCLGEPMAAAEVTEERLIRMASLCGSDCECDLDRSWLYGTQFLHSWGKDRQRLVEMDLDFDPQSALVMVEANQILMRNSDGQGSSGLPNPAGFVIHDLPRLDDNAGETATKRESATNPSTKGTPLETSPAPSADTAVVPNRVDTFGVAGMMGALLLATLFLLGIFVFRQNR